MAEESGVKEAGEESNVLTETLSGLRSLLKERSVSPLFPAFVLSWLLVNYRFVLIILSGESLDSKLAHIDRVFDSFESYCWNGFLTPLLLALAYIYFYPLFSAPIYEYSLNRQRELREARQKANQEKLLSEKDKQQLLAFTYAQKEQSKKQIDQLLLENEQLNARIQDLRVDAEQLRASIQQRDTAASAAKEASGSLPAVSLSELEAAILISLNGVENTGGEVLAERDAANAIREKTDVTGAKAIMADLDQKGLIFRRHTEKGIYIQFTDNGRRAIKQYLANKENEERVKNIRDMFTASQKMP